MLERADAYPCFEAAFAAGELQRILPTRLSGHIGVVSGFGALWKITRDHDIADYVAAHKAHLAALLLFELAHEGQPTPGMERAAELGHLRGSFDVWANRLSSETRR